MKGWGRGLQSEVQPRSSALAFVHEALAGIKGAEGPSGGRTVKVHHPDPMALGRQGGTRKQWGLFWTGDR